VSGTQVTYVYNVGNIIVPSAPYQGGPGGQGEPIIPATPSSQTTNSAATGTLAGSQTLDVSLYTLRLGPSFYWDLSDQFAMSLSAGPAFGVVNGEYKFNETISVTSSGIRANNTGSINATDLVWGGYVNAMFMYHTKENADIYIGAQYMPMTDATISGGGRECQLQLGGQVYLSIGVNWAF
jgi:hypothetical protein